MSYSWLPLGGSCPQSGLKRSIMSYSRLPLRGGSAAQRRWRGPPRLSLSGFSRRTAAQRQSRRLALPTKRTEEVNYLRFISGFPSGGKLCHAVAVMRGASTSNYCLYLPYPQNLKHLKLHLNMKKILGIVDKYFHLCYIFFRGIVSFFGQKDKD